MRRAACSLGILAGAILVPGVSAVSISRALASDPLPQRAEHIPTPGRNAASEDSAESVITNPANLAFMPGAEGRWTYVRCPDDAKKVGCGHAFDLATPLLFNISTGVRVDYVQPPWGASQVEGVGFPYRGFDYTWVTWGVGVALSDQLALGVSLQRAYSPNGRIDGLFGLTAGISYRPYRNFAFAAVAHDLNGPSNTSLLPLKDQPILDASYVFSAAFRPTGRRNFEIGFEMKYLQGARDLKDSDQWLPRATLGIDIPNVGRARGDVEIAHLPNDTFRGVVGTAGLEIAFDRVTFGAGALFGDGLGSSTTVGEYGTVSIAGYRSPGVPKRNRAVSIRLESTPSPRGHVSLLKKLWAIADDPEISALALVLRAEPASSYAHAEELADALRLIRAKKKKVLCSFEDNGAKSLYVCANADRIVINPAGGIRYAGLRSEYIYLASLLSKLGIHAEFVRIGAHKTAPEQFMNEHASDTARADHEDLLRQVEAVFVRNLSLYRHLPEDKIRAETAKGPFVAEEATKAGFADAFAFDDEVERATLDLVRYAMPYEKYERDTLASDSFGPRSKIAVLHIDGDIVDGRSSTVPILDMKLVGSYSIVDTVKQLKDDPSVRAVVLRIESPGGSSMASDVMWRELVQLSDAKPLLVSMGSVAASGGYYIAVAGRKIFALPLTVTGSIGIFYGKADISELLKKIGVGIDTYKTTSRADAESLYRPFTADERVELEHKIHQFYDVFLDRVAKGRHMTKEQVDAVGQGRVWTGQQAFDRHLVDSLGGLRQAIDEARTLTGLPKDAPIVEYPAVESSLIDKVLGLLIGFGSAQTFAITSLPPQLREIARAIAPMAIYNGRIPLARMEWMPVDSDGSVVSP